jgi:hypothetical protein
MPLESLPVEFLYTIHLDTGAPVMISNGPAGTKLIAPVTGGTFEGPRMKGSVAVPAGDWGTDDGANIYCTYSGLLVRSDDGMRALGAPLFQTGDERYAWLNSVQGIGLGTAGAGGVDYDIYAIK